MLKQTAKKKLTPVPTVVLSTDDGYRVLFASANKLLIKYVLKVISGKRSYCRRRKDIRKNRKRNWSSTTECCIHYRTKSSHTHHDIPCSSETNYKLPQFSFRLRVLITYWKLDPTEDCSPSTGQELRRKLQHQLQRDAWQNLGC